MFIVLYNGMYAESTTFTKLKGKGWKTCIFQTYEQAIEYSNKWLGNYGPLPIAFPLNFKFKYGYTGDTIEIRNF